MRIPWEKNLRKDYQHKVGLPDSPIPISETTNTVNLGSIHKRAPQRPAALPTDIYISNKSKSYAIIKRVTRLMLKEK